MYLDVLREQIHLEIAWKNLDIFVFHFQFCVFFHFLYRLDAFLREVEKPRIWFSPWPREIQVLADLFTAYCLIGICL